MGYFDDWASSPIATIGLPLAAGALATRNPTTARGVGIGLGTLNLIQQAQARNEEDRRRQMLAQALPGLIGATTPVTSTKVGIDPQTASYSLPDAPSQTAMNALSPTPQENNLYQTHLANLRTNPVRNPDGSVSTLKQTTFEEDGRTYNIPTIWDGAEHDPNIAWARAKKIGLANFPSYNSDQAAESRYQQMHDAMAKDVSQAGPVNQWANIADSGPLAPPKPLPTYQATENKPVFSPEQQSVLRTLAPYAPQTVASALATNAFKQNENKYFGNPEKGIYSVNQSGVLTELKAPEKKASIADIIAAIPGGNNGQLPPGVSASVPTEGGGRVNLAYPEAANQAKAKRIPPSVAQAIGTPNFNTALKAAQDSGEIGDEGAVGAMAQNRAELANQRADKASERADAASARADKLANARLDAVNNPKPESPSILGERANTIAQKLAANGATDAQINAQLAPLNYRVASRQKGWFSDSVTIEPATQPPTQSPQPKPIPQSSRGGQVMSSLPDPVANAGRTIRETQTGRILKSDGKRWLPVTQ